MRDIVHCNSVCYRREIERKKQLHARRIAHMAPTSKTNSKSQMDCSRPRTLDMKHIKRKSNTRFREDEEFARIERENHMLMSKMDKIFSSSVVKNRKMEGAHMFSPGVRLNGCQVPQIDCYLTQQGGESRNGKYAGQGVRCKSLNNRARQMEYSKIMQENAAMLRRIVDGKASYSRDKQVQDRKKQERLLCSISRLKDHTSGHLRNTTGIKTAWGSTKTSSMYRSRSLKSSRDFASTPDLERPSPEKETHRVRMLRQKLQESTSQVDMEQGSLRRPQSAS